MGVVSKADADESIFRDSGDVYCRSTRMTIRAAAYAGFYERIRERGQIPGFENPTVDQILGLAKRFGMSVDACDPQRYASCMKSFAISGKDGLMAIVSCSNNELRHMGFNFKIAQDQLREFYANNPFFLHSMSCHEKVWIIDRKDYGTAERACK